MQINRRQIVIFSVAAAVAGPSFASGYQDEIVASLRAQGYEQITIETTLLGRVRITAMRQSNLREIVFNPRTGEILRDLWLTPDGQVAVSEPKFDDLDLKVKDDDGADSSGSDDKGSEDSGSGSSGSGDDASDDDKSDADKSDNEDSDDSDDNSGGARD